MKSGDSMKPAELVETIANVVALLSLIPVAYWWHMKELAEHKSYFYYLSAMLCILGYVTYKRIKRLRAAMKAAEKKGSGPRIPPFFQ